MRDCLDSLAVQRAEHRLAWQTTLIGDAAECESIPGWDLDYVQMAGGALRGSIIQLVTPEMQLVTEKYSGSSLHVCGSAWQGSFTFAIPHEMDEPGRYNGRGWHGQACLSRGDRHHEAWIPQMRISTIAMESKILVEHAAGEQLDLTYWLDRQSQMVCDFDVVSTSAKRIDAVLEASGQDGPATQPRHVQAIETELLDLVMELVVSAKGSEERVPMRHASRMSAVRVARDYVMANLSEQHSVSDLCRVTRLSRRALHLCFQDVLNTSVLQYLHMLKLAQARRLLLRADPDMRVKDVVEQVGVWHQGRFASEYKKVYGELPSATLMRTRSPTSQ